MLTKMTITILNATPAMADVISGRVPKPSPDLPIPKTCAYLKMRQFLNLPPEYSLILRRRQKSGSDSSAWPQRLREALGDPEARVIKIGPVMAAIQEDGTRAAYIKLGE